jgi:prevent-host-death family protein
VDVAITELRAELADWIHRARDGDEVVITDRGVPVARLVPVQSASLIERLTRDGVLGKPRRASRPSATMASRVTARGPVSEIVAEQRR